MSSPATTTITTKSTFLTLPLEIRLLVYSILREWQRNTPVFMRDDRSGHSSSSSIRVTGSKFKFPPYYITDSPYGHYLESLNRHQPSRPTIELSMTCQQLHHEIRSYNYITFPSTLMLYLRLRIDHHQPSVAMTAAAKVASSDADLRKWFSGAFIMLTCDSRYEFLHLVPGKVSLSLYNILRRGLDDSLRYLQRVGLKWERDETTPLIPTLASLQALITSLSKTNCPSLQSLFLSTCYDDTQSCLRNLFTSPSFSTILAPLLHRSVEISFRIDYPWEYAGISPDAEYYRIANMLEYGGGEVVMRWTRRPMLTQYMDEERYMFVLRADARGVACAIAPSKPQRDHYSEPIAT